jgi:hypothetical protein
MAPTKEKRLTKHSGSVYDQIILSRRLVQFTDIEASVGETSGGDGGIGHTTALLAGE